jgi:hypothetical protein
LAIASGRGFLPTYYCTAVKGKGTAQNKRKDEGFLVVWIEIE